MRTDLDGLEVLIAIADTGTFAAAAKQVHRTQSAVSYAVARLEAALGVQLFDRSGHRAVLSAEGRVLLQEARQVVDRARRLEHVSAQLRQGWEAQLQIIVDGVLPIEPVLEVLRELVIDAIPTRVQVKMEFLRGVQYRFELDEADVMVVKDWTASPALAARALAPVEVVLLCARSHPLAAGAHDGTVLRSTLREHVELTIQDSSPGAQPDARMFGCERVFYLSDFHAKKAALLAGLGFGWVPAYMVVDELASGALVEVPYGEGSRYAFTPVAVHRLDRPLGPAAERFLEALVRRAGQGVGP